MGRLSGPTVRIGAALAALLWFAAPILAGSFGCQPAPVPRILILGDSLTAGFGLPPSRGLVPELSRWLTAHGAPAALVNGGLTGDTTFGGRVRIGPALTRHRPDAVVVELGANEMLMGWSPEAARRNLDTILGAARRNNRPVLLVGIDLPVAHRADWAAIWPALARRHGAALLPDLARPLTRLPAARRAALLQPDGLHPSAEGAALLARGLGPEVQALVAALDARRANADTAPQ